MNRPIEPIPHRDPEAHHQGGVGLWWMPVAVAVLVTAGVVAFVVLVFLEALTRPTPS